MPSILFSVLLVFSGAGFNQQSDATVCNDITSVFNTPPADLVIVSATITSSVNEIFEEPKDGVIHYADIKNEVTSEFTIDKIIYGNTDFPLRTDSITTPNGEIMPVGKQFITHYGIYESGWFRNNDCGNLYPPDMDKYFDFYFDLRENPCEFEQDYLIKRSDLSKICVSEDTRDKLVERGYGFYVPSMNHNDWIQILEDPTVNLDTLNKEFTASCVHTTVNFDGDCLPYDLFLTVREKKGNTELTLSELPNLGQVVRATILNSNPVVIEEWQLEMSDIGIIVPDNIKFVQVEKAKVLSHGTSVYYDEISHGSDKLLLEAPITANSHGNTMIEAYGRAYGDDRLFFTVYPSNDSTPGYTFYNSQDEVIRILSLESDKQQYSYPEPVHISGQFSGHAGDSLAFIDDKKFGKQIKIDSENRFQITLDKTNFESLEIDNYYLQLMDYKQGRIYEIKFSYSSDDQYSYFIYWKDQIENRTSNTYDEVYNYLMDHALFTEKETKEFLEMYPQFKSANPQPYAETVAWEYFSQADDFEDILEFFAQKPDESIPSSIKDKHPLEIKYIAIAKQYSEQQLADILEESENIPQYNDRILKYIYHS